MSAAELQQAAETLHERAGSVRRPYATQEKVDVALADWLDEVGAWIEEGTGLLPEGNIGDAWIGMRKHALTLARLINGGVS